MNAIRRPHRLSTLAIALTALTCACFGELEPNAVDLADDDWTLYQPILVEVEVGDALHSAEPLRLEVRHTAVRDGQRLFEGSIGPRSNWRRAFTGRLGRHEEAVRVALTNGEWIRVRTVPLDEDGRALVRFE